MSDDRLTKQIYDVKMLDECKRVWTDPTSMFNILYWFLGERKITKYK